MDLGFRGDFESLGQAYPSHPFDLVWANDLNKFACRTYERNLRRPINCADIWEAMNTLPKRADVVVGGFPCQDISINGKRAGVRGKRSGLYKAMVETVERLRPKAFVAENVKGLLMNYNRSSLRQVMNDFGALGYQMHSKLYHSADYGVPQNRERVFIVGIAQGLQAFSPPPVTHARTRWVTAKRAIADLEGLSEHEVPNHTWSRAAKSGEQGNRKLKADWIAATIRAECHGNSQYHYSLRRRISMREAARFQTFPDDFVFEGGIREVERQVGNAVPPVLAWHIASAVAASLEHRAAAPDQLRMAV